MIARLIVNTQNFLLSIKNYPKVKKLQLGKRCVYPHLPKMGKLNSSPKKIIFTPKLFYQKKNYPSYVLGISIYAQNILGETCFVQIQCELGYEEFYQELYPIIVVYLFFYEKAIKAL